MFAYPRCPAARYTDVFASICSVRFKQEQRQARLFVEAQRCGPSPFLDTVEECEESGMKMLKDMVLTRHNVCAARQVGSEDEDEDGWVAAPSLTGSADSKRRR